MRRWQHKVGAEWLEARKSVLTATDVSGLQAEYKRYLKAGDPGKIMPGFAALWAMKHSAGTPDVDSPSPAAARGHVMEPYAVESWNRQVDLKFHHWDDCIICKGGFGFSPDAMNVPQLTGDSKLDVTHDGKFIVSSSGMRYDSPTEVMEVKSYDVASHMKAIAEDRMKHKELMQLAMAFAVFPNLETARLLWFCPDAPISMFTEKYTSDDLHDHVRWIVEIAEVYVLQAQLCEKLSSSLSADISEDQIWLEYLAANSDCDVFMLK